MSSPTSRWIGLAQVRIPAGSEILGGPTAAVVAIVGDAKNEIAFGDLAETELRKLGFELVGLEDVELLAKRTLKTTLPRELIESVDALSRESLIALGTFHAYKDN